jgi:stringent starvation protein B
VADSGDTQERLERVVTRLLKLRLGESLARVEAALGRWRRGELGLFETHAEVLRHGARSEKMVDRMSGLGRDAAPLLVREAFDRGLIDRAEVVGLTGKAPEDLPPPLADDEPALPSKRQVVERLLADGPILVHIDARRGEASVPERFRGDPRLVLRFGYGLTPAIVDLALDDRGLTGTLSFGGVPHRCVLPWPSIYAVVGESDQKGMVWPDDVPPEVQTAAGVGGDASAAAKDEADEPDVTVTPPPRKRGGHLRLVE